MNMFKKLDSIEELILKSAITLFHSSLLRSPISSFGGYTHISKNMLSMNSWFICYRHFVSMSCYSK